MGRPPSKAALRRPTASPAVLGITTSTRDVSQHTLERLGERSQSGPVPTTRHHHHDWHRQPPLLRQYRDPTRWPVVEGQRNEIRWMQATGRPRKGSADTNSSDGAFRQGNCSRPGNSVESPPVSPNTSPWGPQYPVRVQGHPRIRSQPVAQYRT